MTKERIAENESTVKNKRRTRQKRRWESHKIEDGFAVTIREFTRGMDPSCVGKTRPGRLNNSAYHIKKTAMEWVDAFPKKINGVPTGFTSAIKRIYKAIVWAHLMNRGYAVFSYDTLADAADCDRRTVHRAVNFFRTRGLIQFKTGKGWGQEERRSLANQYTANFWAFINPETGTIITPPHHTGIYEWELAAAGFRARLEKGPLGQNVTMVSKRGAASSGNGARKKDSDKMSLWSDQQNGVPPPDHSDKMSHYRDNGRGRSASATANAPSGAPASEETRSGKTLTGFSQVKDLMHRGGLIPQGFISFLKGKPFPGTVERLGAFCQTLKSNPPTNGIKYSRIVIYGDRGSAEFIEGNVSLSDLRSDDWLAVEYRSP